MAGEEGDLARRQAVAIARLKEQIIALRQVIDERDKQVAVAFHSAAKATEKAEDAQQRVNLSQNEFRGALKDQAATLATKEDVERLVERVVALERALSSALGRSGGSSSAQSIVFQILPILLAAAALVASLVMRGGGP